MIKKEWIYSLKRISRVIIDLLLFTLSLIISYKLRLEHNISTETQGWFWSSQFPFVLPIVLSLRLIFLFVFQIYSRMWRYTELNEILEITKPIFCSSLILAIPRIFGFTAYNQLFAIPIGVNGIEVKRLNSCES